MCKAEKLSIPQNKEQVMVRIHGGRAILKASSIDGLKEALALIRTAQSTAEGKEMKAKRVSQFTKAK